MQFINEITIFLHLVAAIFWVGGIFLVYMVFRPVALELEPPIRLKMFLGVFQRFFPWVWAFIAVLVVTGYADWMYRFDGMNPLPLHILAMELIGWIMVVLFAWLYFVFYKQFKSYVEASEFALAGKVLNSKMRPIIVTNLVLGVFEALIGSVGGYW